MAKKVSRLRGLPGGGYTVYRTANSSPEHIAGENLSLSVQNGVLIVMVGGNPVYVFSKGQWLTVNIPPI